MDKPEHDVEKPGESPASPENNAKNEVQSTKDEVRSTKGDVQNTKDEGLPSPGPGPDPLPSPGMKINPTPPEPATSISPPQSPTATSPQLENPESLADKKMEVPHRHLHHSKTWKDYLFEFFMLFLAVTAGFFVENKRENYIEHERAEQFSRQLLADLRSDSLLFENRNRAMRSMEDGYKTLIIQLTQKQTADSEVLKTLLPLSFVFDFPTTATTYNQMKTSGSLRYIDNDELVQQLRDCYDVLLPRVYRIAQASLDYYTTNINPYYLKHIRIQDYDPFEDTLINKHALIMQRSSQSDQELANIMGGYWSLIKIQLISMNEPALKKIRETIATLKEEYHLK